MYFDVGHNHFALISHKLTYIVILPYQSTLYLLYQATKTIFIVTGLFALSNLLSFF